MVFVKRGLSRGLMTSRRFPVTILEGRRAVGKTTLTKRLEEDGAGYAFYSLIPSAGNLRQALDNPVGWLESLESRCVIDEAQLLDNVTQHVKELVDRMDSHRRFILTGSASVGRSRGGTPDWLTGRANRLELLPFSASELSRRGVVDDYSLVDALFQEDWEGVTVGDDSPGVLAGTLRRGGMPNLCLPGMDESLDVRDINHLVASEVELALGRDVLPGLAFDATTAKVLFDALLRMPGGLLNRYRLAEEIGIDQRTVVRYLDVLAQRFLIHFLPNLRGSAAGLNRRQQKVHAVDTSNVCESVARAGHDITADNSLLGMAFETWVVNQIRAENGWAQNPCRLGYWRETSNNREYEVDLVLVNNQNQAVAIEVKSSSAPSPRDFTGIKRFREVCAKQGWVFHRGFVVCTTQRSRGYGEDLWAIPYQSFADYPITKRVEYLDSKEPHEALPVVTINDSLAKAASVFISYVHADDDYLHGTISALAGEIGQAYEFQTGEKLDIFLDRASISWGQDWQKAINRHLTSTAFLLAMVTPRYLQSKPCRDELIQFTELSERAGYEGVLSLIIQPLPDQTPPSPAYNIIQRYQYRDVPVSFASLAPGSAEFRALAANIASQLHEVIHRRETDHTDKVGKKSNEQGEEIAASDMDGYLDACKQTRDSTALFMKHLNEAVLYFNRLPGSGLESNGFTAVDKLYKAMAHLEKSTTRFTTDWGRAARIINTKTDLVTRLKNSGDSRLYDAFKILLAQVQAVTATTPGVDTIRAQVTVLAGNDRQFVRARRIIEAAIQTVEEVQSQCVQLQALYNSP